MFHGGSGQDSTLAGGWSHWSGKVGGYERHHHITALQEASQHSEVCFGRPKEGGIQRLCPDSQPFHGCQRGKRRGTDYHRCPESCENAQGIVRDDGHPLRFAEESRCPQHQGIQPEVPQPQA